MEQTSFRSLAGDRRDDQERVGTPPDPVATAPTTTPDVANMPRQRFTMMVEDVAAQLHTYGLDRDQRTIQRWCKSGKILAMIDHANGDKYRIDPSSVQRLIDDILAEQSRQTPVNPPTPRQPTDDVAPPTFTPRFVSQNIGKTPTPPADNRPDTAATPGDDATTSQERRDDVAALERRVVELEKENRSLEVDKRVREELVDYLKENFQSVLDQAMTGNHRIGELEAEVRHLQALLPAPAVDRRLPFEHDTLEANDFGI